MNILNDGELFRSDSRKRMRLAPENGYSDIFLKLHEDKIKSEKAWEMRILKEKAIYDKEIAHADAKIKELQAQVNTGARNAMATTYNELDRLKIENAKQKEELQYMHEKMSRQYGNAVVEFAKEKFEAIRQRREMERELWVAKTKLRSGEIQLELHTLRAENSKLKGTMAELRGNTNGRVSVTGGEFEKFQALLAMEGELDAVDELFDLKNAEIDELKVRINILEDENNRSHSNAEHYDADGEPRWKRYMNLYHSELECDSNNEPVLDETGNAIPVRIGLEKRLKEAEQKIAQYERQTAKKITGTGADQHIEILN